MNPVANDILEADLNDERQALEVLWGDQHRSVYPLKQLRAECPCATCRAERDEARNNPFRVIAAGTRAASSLIVNMEAVGRYAIRPTWSDGHQAGIYTFEYLRQVCPCEVCQAARKPEGPYAHGIYIPKG